MSVFLRFFLAVALAVVPTVASGASQPVANSDVFVLKDGKLKMKNFEKTLNLTWYSSVSEYDLDVLVNDFINEEDLDSCILSSASDVNPATASKIFFKDIAKDAGFTHTHRDYIGARPHCVFDFVVPFYNSSKRAVLPGEFCTTEQMTGGAAVGDYDNDGLLDVFFAVFTKRSVLYKNLGNGKFKDVTIETNIGPAMYANGAVWVDVDQDGDLDLYVTTMGGTQHYLYINYGGRFREEAKERNISMQSPNKRKLSGFTSGVGDFDQDGYPDIYVSEWILHSQSGLPSASRLMRNLGKTKPGYFEDVTVSAGVEVDHLWTQRTTLNAGTHTFGASFTDFDNDGLQELLITGDYGESRMFWNNGNKTFTDCTKKCGLIVDVDAMGHAIGDWNNDGNLEWFSTAIFDNATNCEVTGCMFGNKGNKLFKNLGDRKFTEVADYVGVRDGGWGWGATFFDFNNDGYLDLVNTNGLDTPSTTIDDVYRKQQMRLFKNVGPNVSTSMAGKMTEVSSEYGMTYTGLGRGLMKFDFDNDGDEDIIIAANIGPAVFYENVGGNQKSWLRVQVFHRCGCNKAKLCDSYGARVTVEDPSGHKQTSEIGSSTHFLGQSEMAAHFGLRDYSSDITVRVKWPATNQTIIISNVMSKNVLRLVRPPLTDNRVNVTKMNFTSLTKCPRIKIAKVNVKPGARFSVDVNPDKRSLKLKLHPAIPLTGLAMQSFTYDINVENSKTGNVTRTATAKVTIDARVYIRNKTVSSICPNGKMWLPGMPVPVATKARQFDGVSNNMQYLHWGAAKENLRRLVPSKYVDDISMPAGSCTPKQRKDKTCPYPNENSGYGSTRPAARHISNELFMQKEWVESERGLSDLFVHYGQFLAHDLDFSSPLPRFEFQGHLNEVWMQITVPKGDPHFDQDKVGGKYLPFSRSTYNRCTGSQPNGFPREQVNKISSYIDATDVYGSTESRCKKLRSMVDGKLKLDEDGIIPKNREGLENDNPVGRTPAQLRVAGDTRSNVAPGLIMLHTLFVLEHNRLCDEYKKKNPQATDEEIFKYAKRIVTAEHQAIVFREYLPALVGASNVPAYKGYNSSIDATVSNVFATAAFRFGHSQVNTHIFRFDEKWNVSKYGHLLLRESYFHPERVVEEGGIEPIIRGTVMMPAQKIDTLMIDELRNVLFPVGRGNGLDLAAMNIQRGRDHGLPDYNSVRKLLGLKGLQDFSEITKDTAVASKLKTLYKDINNIDLWIGGLAEDHMPDSELGETFQKIFIEGLLRIRDGDRFWYESTMSKEEIKMVNSLTLSKIIKANTNVKDIPDNVFFSMKRCKDVTNSKCVFRESQDLSKLLQKINLMKTKHSKAEKEHEESIRRAQGDKDSFKRSTIGLGVACVVVIVVLCVVIAIVVRKRGLLRTSSTSLSDSVRADSESCFANVHSLKELSEENGKSGHKSGNYAANSNGHATNTK
eukprot:gene20124-22096_t